MQRKGCLGCSLPLTIGILVVVVALFVIGLISGALGQAVIGESSLSKAIAIEAPHIQLPGETIFHIGSFAVTNTLITSWITIVVIVALFWSVTHRIKLIPSRLQSLLEFTIEWMLNLCIDVAGEKYGRRFFPIITTIFLFVLINAWMNLIPGYGSILAHVHGHEVHLLRGANTDINVPLAIASISWIFVLYYGLKEQGGHFLETFFNGRRLTKGFKELFTGKIKSGFVDIGFGFIDGFVGLLELMSFIFRIFSFTFRLFGNMTGGEILLVMMIFLVPWVVALPFYGLEILIGLVQAVIFSGLTLVFATVAVTSHGDEESHEGT